MLGLSVWLTLQTGENIHCGELVFGNPDARGDYRSAFRYTSAWLNHPQAFPIDPLHLPLESAEWGTDRLNPPLMVIEDALPDDWGRKLLVRRAGLPRAQQSLPYLLQAQGNGGLGALSFLPLGAQWQPRQTHTYNLQNLDAAVKRYELGQTDVDPQMAALLNAGGSPGGARPKALVYDQEGDWIAKFRSIKDTVDMVGLEAATLELARLAGLTVPEFKVVQLGASRKVLLVKRFDIAPGGGRYHMMSFQTALAAGGWYVVGYKALVDWVRKHGSMPDRDVPALYRWMVFNALVGNTDDHLKNFWLLGGYDGYKLAPSFDLLPDVNENREHILNFDLNPTIKPGDLVELGKKWGVSRARALAEGVFDVMPEYPSIARRYGVPEQEIERYCRPVVPIVRTPDLSAPSA